MSEELNYHIESRIKNILADEPVNMTPASMMKPVSPPVHFGAGKDWWNEGWIWFLIGWGFGVGVTVLAYKTWMWLQKDETELI